MSFTNTEPASHQSENTWFTPKDMIEKIGEFDTDPCTMSYRPFDLARKNIEFDKGENGLELDWSKCGRMFINPPYGKQISPFVDKFISETPDGMMLIFARMGSRDVQKLIENGAYFFLLRKRVYFINKEGVRGTNAGTDSMLVFWKYDEIYNIDLAGALVGRIR